jgi:hypothetical protein
MIGKRIQCLVLSIEIFDTWMGVFLPVNKLHGRNFNDINGACMLNSLATKTSTGVQLLRMRTELAVVGNWLAVVENWPAGVVL